jgi:predicted porin
MKKTLIAVAALAATGAFAQVTVYGRLDAGYAVTTSTANGVDTKANGVQSHNSVSSMWGIQGSEDLGGGLKATFKLEQDIYTANGNTGVSGAGGGSGNASGFNRTSLLGLSGGFGSIAFGRDYVPTFKLVAATDINGLSRVSTVQLAAAGGQSTAPNLVFYSSPNLSGFQVNLAYGNQDTTSNAGDNTTKITNITATYTNGPLMVGLGTGTTEIRANGAPNGGANISLGNASIAVGGGQIDRATGTVLAASYNFGSFMLGGNMITNKVTTATGDAEASEINLGVTVPMGKVLLKGQVGTNKIKGSSIANERTGSDVVLGVDYNLSNKTALFVTTGTVGNTSGTGSAQDNKVVSTAVGIKTVF